MAEPINFMFIRDLDKCKEFIASDNSVLRELLNPAKDDIELRYSLAHATVKPGMITQSHKLAVSEVYYILIGTGIMYIDDKTSPVRKGHVIYIPPNSVQRIKNTGQDDLKFLCIVDPPWKPQDETPL